AGQFESSLLLSKILAMILLLPQSSGRHKRKLLTDNTEIIEIHSGLIQGFRQNVLNSTIHSFLGIPFAEPPLGPLRFRKPVPVKPWTGVKTSFELPPRCAQLRIVSQEDCLYLNVWTPTLDASAGLDVMVYFHGGVFLYERPLIQRDLRYMASMGDVVIVKMNYRLGAFGFLHAHNDDVPGNMGIHDMHLALLWVRRNIKSFGGDPSRITAFGSSAGAMSIGLMLTSPIASHLIQVAILQSGSPCVPMIARVNNSLQAADELAFRTGCATGNMSVHTHGRQVVGCLRRVNVRRILKVQESMFKKLLLFLPIFGDDLLPINILRAVERGLFPKGVKMMLGVTPDEGTTILTT
ncbi:unnamed protein product, partial [Ixodes pacificus]